LTDRVPAPPLTAVDLFCGAGGLSRGLADAGIAVLAAADNWAPAQRTYEANFGHPFLRADLGDEHPEAVADALDLPAGPDIVVGGPPCQGFSIQRIGGDADARNDLVLRFAALALALGPRAVVMENVPGLLGKRGAAIAGRYVQMLAAAGYRTSHHRLNAVDYGVPQLRRRVVFLSWREGDGPLAPPRPSVAAGSHVTVAQAIGDLPSPPTDLTPHPDDPLHRRTRLSRLNEERLRHIPPGGGFEHLPVDLRVACHRDGPGRIGHRNVYGRLHPHEPSVTITARFDSFTRGKFAHPWEDRNITLREGARLQSFPDDHAFHGTQEEVAALIGNAVPPVMAHAVAEAVARSLRDPEPAAQLQLLGASAP
jgi:DNA (cytosine-5)-methyltransferase 1